MKVTEQWQMDLETCLETITIFAVAFISAVLFPEPPFCLFFTAYAAVFLVFGA